ncbi:MAG: hypothetical protein HRU38_24315 [Saccharospirillaceae bacterium]|nr:hypothetical protein [Pseudomonadales bacterium]NRB81746.1 hypothetical protein [Saccharospirillaceae bacterium]
MGWFKDKCRAVANFVTFGAVDKREAKNIERDSENKRIEIQGDFKEAEDLTKKRLADFGTFKSDTYLRITPNFQQAFDVLSDVNFSDLNNQNEKLEQFNYDFKEMKKISTSLSELALLGAGSALTGAAVATGAMGFVALLGTASTGTAISTLSGVAATNATVAWFGGGALSVGGLGIAGGTAVIGGIALAPLVIFGMVKGVSKGKQKLNVAKDHADETEVLEQRIITIIAEFALIRRGCDLLEKTIRDLESVLMFHIERMQLVHENFKLRCSEANDTHERMQKNSKSLNDIFLNKINSISKSMNPKSTLRTGFVDSIAINVKKLEKIDEMQKQEYTDREKQVFMDAFNCMSIIKQLLDKPIMGNDGGFLSSVMEDAQNAQEYANFEHGEVYS